MSEHKNTGGSFLIHTPEPDEIFTPEDFGEEALLLAQTTREFVANEIEPELDRLEAKDNDFMVSLMKQAGEIGLLAADVPEAWGGLDVPKSASMLLAESLARAGSFTVTHGAHSGIGTLPIVYFGIDEQKKEWLPRLSTG